MQTMRNHRKARKPYKLVTEGGYGPVLSSHSTLTEACEALAAYSAADIEERGLCICIALPAGSPIA